MFSSIGQIIWMIIIGVIVGVIAKLIMPGRDPGGFWVTAIIGIVGSFIGTFIGRALWGGHGYTAGWIMSIVGAIIVLAVYRLFARRAA